MATLIANAPRPRDLLISLLTGTVGSRPGLVPSDAARYLLFVALGLLLGLIPGADDPDQVKRYVRTFVLPALLNNPPPAEPDFGTVSRPVQRPCANAVAWSVACRIGPRHRSP